MVQATLRCRSHSLGVPSNDDEIAVGDKEAQFKFCAMRVGNKREEEEEVR